MRNSLLFVFLVLAAGCIDKKDYTLTSVVVNPTIAVPVASGDLSILDVLKQSDSSYIKIDATDQVYLDYHQTLFSANIRQLFTIPNKTVSTDIPIPSATIPPHSSDIVAATITEVIDLGLTPAELSQIDFKTGTITFNAQLVPGNSNLPVSVTLSSTDIVNKATGSPFSVQTPPAGTYSLADNVATLNKNKFNLKFVVVLKSSSTTAVIAPNTSVHIDFKMDAMDFHLITGFLGDQTVSIQETTLQIGAFGTSLESAATSFKSVTVGLDVVDDYGVPCRLDFSEFKSVTDGGKTVNAILNPANPVNINYPTTLGMSATTHIDATNAKQMLDIGPTRVIYKFDARINSGLTSGNNFVADTSKLRATLHVTVPLSGHANNMSLYDTLKLDLSKVDQSEVTQASLKVNVTNELPLGGTMQFYFIDANNKVIDSLLTPLQTALLPASVVSAAGDLETPGMYDSSIPLSTDQLNTLFVSKGMVTKVVLSTSKDDAGATVDVNFRSKYRIKMNMGILANVKFDLEK